jgi:hypothetical protein
MTTIARQAAWAATAPQCNCKSGEKISFICLHPHCPAFESHKLYCMPCLQNGIHQHPDHKHKDAAEFAIESNKNWTAFKEFLDQLQHDSMENLKKFKPLINYLEEESINMNIIPQGYTSLSDEMEILKDLAQRAEESLHKVE